MLQRQFSAGGVVFKKNNNEVLWLISKSTPSKDYPNLVWRFQKGWLDDEMTGPGPYARGEKKADEEVLQAAALREVQEEGGVIAEIVKKIETTKFFFAIKGADKVLKFVTYYLMKYLQNNETGFGPETSEVKWLDYEKARKLLTIQGERKILDKAHAMLNSGSGDALV